MPDRSILFGYSFAPQAGFIPKSFPKIQAKLITKREDLPQVHHNQVHDTTLVQQFIDSYGKLGFLYYGYEHIKHLSSNPSSHHGYYYHLYNLVYDTKAYLDSISVMLNHVYKIGVKGGNIDVKHGVFRDKIIDKDENYKQIFNEHLKWINEVIDWRDSLIHKFSIVITTGITGNGTTLSKDELDAHFKTNPRYLMESKPIPFFGWGIEPVPGYKPDLVQIIPFCERWISQASEFYDKICYQVYKQI
ncbi:MAG: hypothetical protein ACTSW1_06655 [Candidatus Hodarchaeales archaeon]